MLLFRYILIGSALLMIPLYAIWGMQTDFTPFSYVFVILANIYMVISARRNFLLFIVAFILFFSNYSIIYANYADTIFNVFTTRLSERSFVTSMNVLVLFNLLLLVFVRWECINPGFKDNVFIDERKRDNMILYILYALLIPIFFLGFTIPEVEGQRGSHSTAYEYSAILFLLHFYYCGYQKWHTIFGLFLVTVYSLQSFVFGGRIEAIQFILVAYVMLYMHRISMAKVITAMLVMFALMSIIGQVRGELLSGNADVGLIMSDLAANGFALDTAYAAYYASESFVYIIDKFTPQEILVFFWEFVKSLVVGSNPDMLLTSISKEYVFHYGGGILPYYFYFYLGFIGILISSILVAFYLNKIIGLGVNSSGYMKCLAVWIVSTTFRWYLYTPLPLLRGVLFLTIAYFSFSYLHKISGRIFVRKEKAITL